MELLEGQTLKHRIGDRPLPLDLVLDLGVQIADALAAAHAGESSRTPHAGPEALALATIRAVVDLQAGRPTHEIGILEPFAGSDEVEGPGAHAMLTRARALVAAGEIDRAIAEFRRITDNPGFDPLLWLHPLARLGLARAYARAGDLDRARRAYQDFLALWKDADPDVPILLEAKAEYARLGT